MTTKCTWLFNGVTAEQDKSFGFSETWYSAQTGDAVIRAMDLVSNERRLILAHGVAIVGYRITEGAGRAYVVRKFFKPPNGNDFPNLPVDAAHCEVGCANVNTRKRFFLHALPDDWIATTRIVAARKAAIQNVIDDYSAQNFQARIVDPNVAATPIVSITDVGLVTTAAAHGLVVGDSFTFLRVRDVNGRAIRGVYYVATTPNATTFTVAGWGGATVGRSGKVRKNVYTFVNAISLGDRGIIGAATRKVGRPFFQLRGRAPARR